jgi:hypothetical protein
MTGENLATVDQDGAPNPVLLLFVLLLPLAVYDAIKTGYGGNMLRISGAAAVIVMLLAIPLYRMLFNGNHLRCVKSNGEPDRSGNILLPCAFIGLAAAAAFVVVGAVVCYAHWFATFYRGVY